MHIDNHLEFHLTSMMLSKDLSMCEEIRANQHKPSNLRKRQNQKPQSSPNWKALAFNSILGVSRGLLLRTRQPSDLEETGKKDTQIKSPTEKPT
jgi:hypothetical protein